MPTVMCPTISGVVEGSQIGAYRIVKQIGEGGMGSVWLAEHTMLGRRAAVKLLHPSFSSQTEIVQRFFNEARAATSISDPGIVQIFDFGHHDGQAYIVMELLEGEALDRRFERQGKLQIEEALRIMRQVSSTLGAAHARGIVHRDLKPENIFVVRDPEVVGGERAKILDFGIAKLGQQSGVKTMTNMIMGTPAYMSPEQCRGAKDIDSRSDVYALGCVLFTLVTGRPPFVAEGHGDLIVMHITQTAPRLSSLLPYTSPAVDQLIARCLEKEPSARFADGSELASAIGQITTNVPHGVNVGVPSHAALTVAAKQSTTTLTAAAAQSTAVTRKQGSPLMIAGGVVGVLAIGGGIALFVTRSNDEKAASASAPEPTPTPTPTPTPPPQPRPESSPPNPKVEVGAAMKAAFAQFSDWSRTHANEPCPDARALGAAPDPWGHSFVITCTEQPADQIVGAISLGPDGARGTSDDIASWQLPADVTESVHGARWAPKPPPTPAPVAKSSTKRDKPRPTETSKKPDETKQTKSSKGMELDENGLPISR